MPPAPKAAQVRLERVTPAQSRVVLDNPPLNLVAPEFFVQFGEIITAQTCPSRDDQPKRARSRGSTSRVNSARNRS
jgi:hypothetical protein